MELGDAPGGGALVQRTLPGSPADEALEKGDVILEVNRRAVGSAAEAARAMEAAGGTVLLKIRRGAATRFVAIER
jgi:S1-C subfamily serine protease